MKLAIVGAGVAGLAAALACARAGVAYDLVDRAEQPLEGGVALTLWPNALRALADLGVDARDLEAFVPVEEGEIVDMRGRTLYRLPLPWMKARFGFWPVCVRRSMLLRRMHEAAGAPRVERLTVRRAWAEGSAAVDLETENGTRRYDGLILADGIRGAVRASLVHVRLRPAHYVAWRGIARGLSVGPRMREIWGRGFRFGYASMGPEGVYWFLTLNRSQLGSAVDPAAAWRAAVQMASHAPAEVARLLAGTPPETVYAHDIHDLAPGAPLALGRIALIGDTAHAVTPNLGLGGGLALEDGAALMRAFSVHRVAELPEALPDALGTYARGRRLRVAQMACVTRLLGDVMQWEGKASSTVRDAVFRAMAPLGEKVAWTWMMGG
ncbi:FAD-dependent monooxygenase [Alicyclobacillus vulcanalis]|uniref:2-polyprenyl-6-methoxyphenol hydroxylase n=1 Tax=Alicyclobacillus vulcanalis TaxID=252246 RepID=A0A1N7LJD1_9BACL|nr:FAD-dependent monooxygenase [Alicyclobacillus vulcanalis]SIS73958.1 2-polyprenyl-6-methoxyphenol hydroxylase [Alicyclobacillus vulcanalis]